MFFIFPDFLPIPYELISIADLMKYRGIYKRVQKGLCYIINEYEIICIKTFTALHGEFALELYLRV